MESPEPYTVVLVTQPLELPEVDPLCIMDNFMMTERESVINRLRQIERYLIARGKLSQETLPKRNR